MCSWKITVQQCHSLIELKKMKWSVIMINNNKKWRTALCKNKKNKTKEKVFQVYETPKIFSKLSNFFGLSNFFLMLFTLFSGVSTKHKQDGQASIRASTFFICILYICRWLFHYWPVGGRGENMMRPFLLSLAMFWGGRACPLVVSDDYGAFL